MDDRGAIMRRAWEFFRARFNYPTVPFRSIGRHCFRGCLLFAWQEHREVTEMATTPTDQLAALAETYAQELVALQYTGWGTNVQRTRGGIRAALAPIAAELARREAEQSSLAEPPVTPDLALAA